MNYLDMSQYLTNLLGPTAIQDLFSPEASIMRPNVNWEAKGNRIGYQGAPRPIPVKTETIAPPAVSRAPIPRKVPSAPKFNAAPKFGGNDIFSMLKLGMPLRLG